MNKRINNRMNKKMKIISQLLVLLLVVVGCGQFEQDPLKEYPEDIKNGNTPSKLQAKPDRSALSPEAFRIDVDDVIDLSENQSTPINIGVRILIPHSSFELKVENIENFVGATFQEDMTLANSNLTEKQYVFKWTPPTGFTKSEVVALTQLDLRLNVDSGQRTSTARSVKIIVHRSARVPRIISSSFDKSEVNEGEPATLTVSVDDPDSTSTNPPKLHFEPLASLSEASVYMSYKSTTYNSSTKRWLITYDFNTKENNVTASSRRFAAYFVVASHFGVRSQSTSAYIYVNNDLKPALSTMGAQEKYTFIKGTKSSVSFAIIDPTQDGEVSAKIASSTFNLPGEVALDCVRPISSNKYMSNCEFSWNLPAYTKPSGTTPYYFRVEIANKGYSGGAAVTKTSMNQFTVTVVTTTTTTTTTTTSSTTTTLAVKGGNL